MPEAQPRLRRCVRKCHKFALNHHFQSKPLLQLLKKVVKFKTWAMCNSSDDSIETNDSVRHRTCWIITILLRQEITWTFKPLVSFGSCGLRKLLRLECAAPSRKRTRKNYRSSHYTKISNLEWRITTLNSAWLQATSPGEISHLKIRQYANLRLAPRVH